MGFSMHVFLNKKRWAK